MKVCRSTHPMDNSVYCILVTHYYIVGSGRSNSSALRKRGLGLPTSYGHGLGSRVALHIFPDCCFRQGIEAQSVALAVEPYRREDRKSTRLNSSHSQISYAVFCLKKKKKQQHM